VPYRTCFKCFALASHARLAALSVWLFSPSVTTCASSTMMASSFAARTDAPLERIEALFAGETGYATPKVDVRAAVFDDDDRILMVREKSDGDRWTLPGGWADVNRTVAQSGVKEALEESGFEVENFFPIKSTSEPTNVGSQCPGSPTVEASVFQTECWGFESPAGLYLIAKVGPCLSRRQNEGRSDRRGDEWSASGSQSDEWHSDELLMIFTAYFDEADTHGPSPTVIMAGVVGHAYRLASPAQ
jgi:8-oxo-dGTP pyrophosphatase MutT (NUDIX family)